MVSLIAACLAAACLAVWPLTARAQQTAMKKSGITLTYYDVVSLLCREVLEVLQVSKACPPEEETPKGLPPGARD